MDIIDALSEEIKAWRLVYESDDSLASGWIAFREKSRPTHPHWNILYPTRRNQSALSPSEQNAVLRWFDSVGATPHMLDVTDSTDRLAVSRDEYFLYEGQPLIRNASVAEVRAEETSDMRLFSSAVQRAFQLDTDFTSYFTEKMVKLRIRMPGNFYLAFAGDDLCGCWSTFITSPGTGFVMNFGIFPEYGRQGIAGNLVSSVLELGPSRVITHTNNSILAKTLLPNLGMKSLGTANIVPLVLRTQFP